MNRNRRHNTLFFFALTSALFLLSACSRVTPYSQEKQAALAEGKTLHEAHFRGLEPYRAVIKNQLDASTYASNEWIPSRNSLDTVPTWSERSRWRIAIPSRTHEFYGPWLVALGKGYFEQVGLDVELVPHHRNVDPYALLESGEVDAVMEYWSSTLTQKAGAALPERSPYVAISGLFQHSPFGFFTIDTNTPPDQRSRAYLDPRAFDKSIIGLPNELLHLIGVTADRWDVSRLRMKFINGYLNATRVAQRITFIEFTELGMMKRQIEPRGYRNYSFTPVAETHSPILSGLTVVHRNRTEIDPDSILRYNWALMRATLDLIRQPAENAPIIRQLSQEKSSVDIIAEIWRIRAIHVWGFLGRPPLTMNLDNLNLDAAALLQNRRLREIDPPRLLSSPQT